MAAQSAIPSATALAAAAATARIQAMDAVATNFGVASSDISQEQEKRRREERERKEKRDREERLAQERLSSRPREPSPVRQQERTAVSESQHNQPQQPGDSSSEARVSSIEPPRVVQPTVTTAAPVPGDIQSQTQAALEQAKQLELQKKLSESGTDGVTLSQQENMVIKGQSARHLVMQKLIGARGGSRESKVLCLKNMVASEDVDEQLQEEIEEECSKYGDVENVIIYQVRLFTHSNPCFKHL